MREIPEPRTKEIRSHYSIVAPKIIEDKDALQNPDIRHLQRQVQEAVKYWLDRRDELVNALPNGYLERTRLIASSELMQDNNKGLTFEGLHGKIMLECFLQRQIYAEIVEALGLRSCEEFPVNALSGLVALTDYHSLLIASPLCAYDGIPNQIMKLCGYEFSGDRTINYGRIQSRADGWRGETCFEYTNFEKSVMKGFGAEFDDVRTSPIISMAIVPPAIADKMPNFAEVIRFAYAEAARSVNKHTGDINLQVFKGFSRSAHGKR